MAMLHRVRSTVYIFCLVLLAQSDVSVLSVSFGSSLRIEELLPSKALFGRRRKMSTRLHDASFEDAMEQVSTKSDKERGWPSWYPREDIASSSNITVAKGASSSKKHGVPKKERSMPLFRRRKAKETATRKDQYPTDTSPVTKPIHEKEQLEEMEESKEPNTEPREEGTKDDASPPANKSPQSSKNTTLVPATDEIPVSESQSNETATLSPSLTESEAEAEAAGMPRRASVIVLGSPSGTQYRQYRRQPGPAGLPQQQGPSSMSPNTILLAEIIGSVLGTAMRLLVLTWITRRLASQEESIQPTQHFVWERLNDRYIRDVAALKTAIRKPPLGIRAGRWRWKHVRKQGKYMPPRLDLEKTFARNVVVVELQSDAKGSMDLVFLSDVVTFLLEQHRTHAFGTQRKSGDPMELEVVLLVNSPGGSVALYGLAAAQVQRLSREPGIALTVCVDRYAASGGYMIASQAEKLIAAPFAAIGSVGVIMEGLNFHDFAKRYGIQPLVIKAGESKNPFTTYGPISKQDVDNEKERLEKVHEAFKGLIVRSRPQLADKLGTIANGSIFLGQEALDLQLIDMVMTSDEYLLEKIRQGNRVLRLHRSQQSRFSRRATLTPLDLLPHLRAWLSNHVLSNWKSSDATAVISCLLQTGSLLGFIRYLAKQYWNPR